MYLNIPAMSCHAAISTSEGNLHQPLSVQKKIKVVPFSLPAMTSEESPSDHIGIFQRLCTEILRKKIAAFLQDDCEGCVIEQRRERQRLGSKAYLCNSSSLPSCTSNPTARKERSEPSLEAKSSFWRVTEDRVRADCKDFCG